MKRDVDATKGRRKRAGGRRENREWGKWKGLSSSLLFPSPFVHSRSSIPRSPRSTLHFCIDLRTVSALNIFQISPKPPSNMRNHLEIEDKSFGCSRAFGLLHFPAPLFPVLPITSLRYHYVAYLLFALFSFLSLRPRRMFLDSTGSLTRGGFSTLARVLLKRRECFPALLVLLVLLLG